MSRWLVAALCLTACAGTARRHDGSERIARQWTHALTGDDPRAAYELLAAPVRQNKPYAEFAREWDATKLERARQAEALARALDRGARLGERGELAIGDGQVTPLTHEPEGWRLERPLIAAVRPATPEEAIQRLADALEDRSFPALLRLLSSERQEAARSLLDAFVTGLRDHSTELVEVSEDRATLVWTDGSRRWRVVLKREQGAWRIDDFSAQ